MLKIANKIAYCLRQGKYAYCNVLSSRIQY